MGIIDLFKGMKDVKVELTYPTTSNREILKSDVKEFVVKVLDGGSWRVPSLGGIEKRISPIQIEEVDEIELFDGVRCDMIGHNGNILGYFWKVGGGKSKSKDPFGGLEEITASLEKYNSLKERLGAALGSGGADDDVRQALSFLVEQASNGGGKDTNILSQMKEMSTFMNEFDNMKRVFGGTTGSNEYPTWLKAFTDPNVIKGINSTVAGLVRTAGTEMQVVRQAPNQSQPIDTYVQQPIQQEQQPTQQPVSPQQPVSLQQMDIGEFPADDEDVVIIDDAIPLGPVEKIIEVDDKQLTKELVNKAIAEAPKSTSSDLKSKIEKLPANAEKDGEQNE